jgi:hypothetical protein
MAVRIDRAQLYSSARLRLCTISRNDAEFMMKSGLARRISRAKERRLVVQLIEHNRLLETGREIKPIQSTVMLNLSDMEINAGGRTFVDDRRRRGRRIFDDFAGHRRRMIGNRVDQSMTKVEAWARTGDTKAVRVGPRI